MPKKKKTMKKLNENKKQKNIIIVSIVLIIIILLITLIIIFGSSKKLVCSKKSNENNVLMNSNITLKIKDKKIKYIIVNKNISINNDNNDDINYLEAIKSALDDTYKNQGIEYNIEKKDGKLIIELKYNKERKYILDNLYIGIEDSGASINVVSEDRENNYATIDLAKEYSDKNIIKIMGKAGYSCK